MSEKRKIPMDTLLVHGQSSFEERTGAVSVPIYQSATFRHPGLHESTGYDYSRLRNPTRDELENTIALLEGGRRGFAFSSGMAAVSAALSLFGRGDHLIVSEDLYGGTYRLFEEFGRKSGLEFSYVDTGDRSEVENSLRENSRAFFIETPTNPLMKITDLKYLSSLAKDRNMLLIVDNTFLTPYLQRPLALGADMVVHSGTKYLGGHNDTLAGLLVIRGEDLAEPMELVQKTTGAVLSPFDSWLILRGMKTLGVRLARQEENALRIARWLEGDSRVDRVFYPGLPGHDGYELNRSQADGAGAMISFSVKDRAMVERILRKVEIILFAESLGGVESLITYPAVQTHAAIPEEIRNRLGVTDTLLRLSVGIEAAEDLIRDLDRAMG